MDEQTGEQFPRRDPGHLVAIYCWCFCGMGWGVGQINEAANVIYENVDLDANIIFGALVDPELTGWCSFPFEPWMMLSSYILSLMVLVS